MLNQTEGAPDLQDFAKAVDQALALLADATANAPRIDVAYSDQYRLLLERLGIRDSLAVMRAVEAFLRAGEQYFPKNPGQLVCALQKAEQEKQVPPCHVKYTPPPALPEPPLSPEARAEIKARMRMDLTEQSPGDTLGDVPGATGSGRVSLPRITRTVEQMKEALRGKNQPTGSPG